MSMKKIKRKRGKHYTDKLVQMIAGDPQYQGRVVDVTVRHDDECPMLHGKGYCNCGGNADIDPRVVGWNN